MKFIHTPQEVRNDPDVWRRASFYVIVIESELRRLGGEVKGAGFVLKSTIDGLDIWKFLPRNVVTDIHVNSDEIRGTVYRDGKPTSQPYLAGETVIDMMVMSARVMDIEFDYPVLPFAKAS